MHISPRLKSEHSRLMADAITRVCKILSTESKLFKAATQSDESFVYGGFLRLLAQHQHLLTSVKTFTDFRCIFGPMMTDIDIMVTTDRTTSRINRILLDESRFDLSPAKAFNWAPYGVCEYKHAVERIGDFRIAYDVSSAGVFRESYDYTVNVLAYNAKRGLFTTIRHNDAWPKISVDEIIQTCAAGKLVPLFSGFAREDLKKSTMRYQKMISRGFHMSPEDSFGYDAKSGFTASCIIALDLMQHLSQMRALDSH